MGPGRYIATEQCVSRKVCASVPESTDSVENGSYGCQPGGVISFLSINSLIFLA